MADKNLIPRVFLISTALWVLGSLYFDPPKKTKNTGNDNNNTNNNNSESSSTIFESNMMFGLSTKTARSSQNMLRSNSKDLSSLGNESSTTYRRRRLEGDDDMQADTASPNWGFYVAITPEQQEMYAKSGSPWRAPPSHLTQSS